jgi:hypothetical protein
MSGLARIESEYRDGARVVCVRGEIDMSNAAEVMNAIAAAVPNDASLIVVDLSDTAYLDSAAIRCSSSWPPGCVIAAACYGSSSQPRRRSAGWSS